MKNNINHSVEQAVHMAENSEKMYNEAIEMINSFDIIKNDNEKEREFEKLWNFIFSILNNKEVIRKMKNSDIELI